MRDMNGMAEDVSMDPRPKVQPFRKAFFRFGRPPNSLEDVVYSTAEFPMGFIERLGDSKQSGMT